MQDSHEALPWKQITLFLLTLGVLILCALLLQPFFSAIVAAIVLAVVTQRPYDWLASKIKNRSLCAAVALVLIILAIVIPTFLLAQELGQQAYATINAFRAGAHQEKISSYIANRPALASRIEAFTSSLDHKQPRPQCRHLCRGKPRRFSRQLRPHDHADRRHALHPLLPLSRPCARTGLPALDHPSPRRRDR